MPSPDTSILVVDDAKFSTTVITRTLKSDGYSNIHHVGSAKDALKFQENSPASIIIADWLMPEMDGLEMTRHIRQNDEVTNRYTYIIMLTAKDGMEALRHAFEEGIDDFVNKSSMQQQLLPRVFAAERLVDNQNRLLRANQQLLDANRALQTFNTVDTQTGLGNHNYTLQQLKATLNHSDSRGDATCLILLRIKDWDRLIKQHPAHIIDELITGASRRLRNMVRPLDNIAHIDNATFAIITHQPDISLCTAASYRRIYDGINLRAFKTSIGYLSLTANMALASAHRDFGIPDVNSLLNLAHKELEKAGASGTISEGFYRQM